MSRTMIKASFASLTVGSLLAVSVQGLAQLAPDLRTVTDRQAERVQQQAVERAQRQAEAAQTRVVEQVDTIQSRIVERVGSQVDRVESQVERAQVQARDVVRDQEAREVQEVLEIREAQELTRQLEGVPDEVTREPLRAPEEATRELLAATDDTAEVLRAAPVRRNVPDPDGNPVFVEISIEPDVRAIEFEWVMLVTPVERQQLEAEADDLLVFLSGSQPFTLTDGELLTFRVPPDLDANDAILQLVPENLRDLIDRNHLYDTQDVEQEVHAGATGFATPLALPMAAVCDLPLAIGVIDSAIDIDHAAFSRRARIHRKDFVEAPLAPSLAHGTAVASLLVGEQETFEDADAQTALRPLLPRATLYSAAVFHANEDAEQGATVLRVLAALDWLAGEEAVRVINMSLAGPPNRLLAQALGAATSRGKVVVAASGNDGPHAPLRYPAAYDDVIGVTAVDRAAGIYRWAIQGPQVDYAALGVDVPAATAGGGFGPASGTSLATPVVAAFFACALEESGDLATALAALQARLVDLGEPGADPVYGKGLLHP